MRQFCVAETGAPSRQASIENQLVGAIRRLLARVENYPDLKASVPFLALQNELANTEDRIGAARRFYNGNVRELNNAVESFPVAIVARAFGFSTREFFELEDIGLRNAPQIKL